MRTQHFAVVGAGWAGCAAAIELARAGHRVSWFEAARTPGGRARRVDVKGQGLDNGQHILLGAYSETLRLMQLVGVTRSEALLTLPLQMRYPPGSGGMDFIAPRWPAPLHLAAALLRAKGLAGADKMALARFSTTARWMDWTLHHDCSVAELLERFDQTPRLIQLMWRPLCLAALNTPLERASAQIFLNVLRDSLGARRSASDMLLPKRDLGALLPDAAAGYVAARGGEVHLGARIDALRADGDRRWQLQLGGQWGEAFDGVVLATPAATAAALLKGLDDAATQPTTTAIDAFTHEAITTCYLQYGPEVRLALPFYALIDDAASDHWGQFVFDRGQLDQDQPGLLAVVISASGEAAALGQGPLAGAVAAQLALVLGRPELEQPAWSQVITDKRATYACAPGLVRPANASGLPGLVLAGDYTAAPAGQADYPATLEAAVRSGVRAAALLPPAGRRA